MPMFLLGVVLDAMVTGNINSHQYLRVPSCFLALIGLLVFIPMLTVPTLGRPDAQEFALFVPTITILVALQFSHESQMQKLGFVARRSLRQSVTTGLILESC